MLLSLSLSPRSVRVEAIETLRDVAYWLPFVVESGVSGLQLASRIMQIEDANDNKKLRIFFSFFIIRYDLKSSILLL